MFILCFFHLLANHEAQINSDPQYNLEYEADYRPAQI